MGTIWTDSALEEHKRLMVECVKQELENRNHLGVKVSEPYPDCAGEGTFRININGVLGDKTHTLLALRLMNQTKEQFYINLATRFVKLYLEEEKEIELPPTHSLLT